MFHLAIWLWVLSLLIKSLFVCLFVCCILPPKVALFAAPYRSNFLQALSRGEAVKEEECLANMRQFLVNYSPTVDAIYEMYTRLNAELDYTVWQQHTGLEGRGQTNPVFRKKIRWFCFSFSVIFIQLPCLINFVYMILKHNYCTL